MTDLTDEARIHAYVDLMENRGLAELEVTSKDQRLRLVRALAPAAPGSSSGPANPGAIGSPAGGSADAADSASPSVIRAPMAGTFYRAPAPGSEPFVEVGGRVEAGATVCIIESMKMLNPIRAAHPGVVTTVLVDNGSPVDAGQALLHIR